MNRPAGLRHTLILVLAVAAPFAAGCVAPSAPDGQEGARPVELTGALDPEALVAPGTTPTPCIATVNASGVLTPPVWELKFASGGGGYGTTNCGSFVTEHSISGYVGNTSGGTRITAVASSKAECESFTSYGVLYGYRDGAWENLGSKLVKGTWYDASGTCSNGEASVPVASADVPKYTKFRWYGRGYKDTTSGRVYLAISNRHRVGP